MMISLLQLKVSFLCIEFCVVRGIAAMVPHSWAFIFPFLVCHLATCMSTQGLQVEELHGASELACPPYHLPTGSSCTPCEVLHLDCAQNWQDNSQFGTPPAMVGYMKMSQRAEKAYRCLPPAEERCNTTTSETLCSGGYAGALCAQCDEHYYVRYGRCARCSSDQGAERTQFAVCCIISLAGGFVVWSWLQRAEPQRASQETACGVLKQLVQLQAPVILQLVQIWQLLTVRLMGTSPIGVLLTANEMDSLLSLNCVYGEKSLQAAVFLSPLIPLAVLLGCGAVGLIRPSLGIGLAFKSLSVLYIGGALSGYQLSECREFDTGGELLGEYAFKTLLPKLGCHEHVPFLEAVYYLSVFAYCSLIPGFLLLLWIRQSVALHSSMLVTPLASADGHTRTLQVQPPHDMLAAREHFVNENHLLAATASYLTVYVRGCVKVQLQDKAIQIMPSQDAGDVYTQSSSELGVWNVLASKLVPQDKLNIQHTNTFLQMLIQQATLETTSDPLLAGARQLLCKYAVGSSMWVEIAVKLFIVSFICVTYEHDLQLPLAYTLCMAAGIAILCPYAWPQLNTLHSTGFLCLAPACLSLGRRYDLILPQLSILCLFLLCAFQACRPDCPATLAQRLYKELLAESETLKRGEHVEISVGLLRFF